MLTQPIRLPELPPLEVDGFWVGALAGCGWEGRLVKGGGHFGRGHFFLIKIHSPVLNFGSFIDTL